ncbi:hypothetical protein [Streptomyces fagopyri]|uniref:hypothetical protein n=1 Tax=Streptomyces fagopyri TaxID=2662397 RepID=UPI003711666C
MLPGSGDAPLGAHADAADLTRPGRAGAVADTRAEIAPRRAHGAEYGYVGHVLRPVADGT